LKFSSKRGTDFPLGFVKPIKGAGTARRKDKMTDAATGGKIEPLRNAAG
jgi:hypothetical protein